MPAYLFTFHSYRSWNADHPRGFVQTGRGIQPTNTALARYYDRRAKQDPVLFSPPQQDTILWITWDACNRRGWRLHCVAFEPTHTHILVSWQSTDAWRDVRKKLKNLASWALSQEFGQEGHRWTVRGASRKLVRDRRHFDYLVGKYLPRHRGVFWKEGDAPPVAPAWTRALSTRKPSSSDDG